MIVDQAVRKQALDPRESFIIQAPAGSGKTELLVSRYLTLLATVKNPEEITAITFTKKAASQMQSRVIEALSNALMDAPQTTEHGQQLNNIAKAALAQDEKHHWRILENTARLRITTIDALCASITAQLPITALFGEHYSVTERPHVLYQAAVLELLKGLGEEMPYNEALESLLLYLDNRIDIFEGLIANMLAKREMWLDIIVDGLQHDCLKDLLEHSREELVQTALEKASLYIPDSLMSEIQALVEHARQTTLDSTWMLDDFKTVADFLLTQSGTVRRSVDKRQGFLPKTDEKTRMMALLADCAEHPGFIEQLNTIRLLPEVTFTDATWKVTQALMHVLIAAVAHLQVVFKSKSEVDFNEISQLALKSLGDEQNPTEIMLKLDYRLSHILVDEFQDTSQLQYRLLLALTRGWQVDDGRTLFFVGDPMQSIYRFRQAEVGLFMQIQAEGLGGLPLTPLSLQSNFRSTHTVIDWVNNTFSELFSASADVIKGAVTYSNSVAVDPSDGLVQTLLCQSEPAQIKEIVRQISALKQANAQISIAILVRARTHLKTLLPALSEAGIAYVGVDIEVLTNRPEVLDCLSLAYALYNLEDQLSWMALLRSPLFGLSLVDLELIANFDEALSIPQKLITADCVAQLSEFAQAAIKAKWPTINEQLAIRYRVPVAQLVKTAWQCLGGPATCESESALANVSQFFGLLARFVPKHQLVARLELEKALLSLFAKPDGKDLNPVSVMTIHKAKGLEFDVVFFPMLDRASRAQERPLLLWQDREQSSRHELLIAPHRGKEKQDSPMYRFLFELEKERGKNEMVRLFYVAATRAKTQLILSATAEMDEEGEFKKPKSGSLLSVLMPILREDQIHFIEGEGLVDESTQACFKRVEYEWQAPLLEPVLNDDDLNHPAVPVLDQQDWRAIGVVVHAYLELIANHALFDFDLAEASSAIHKRLLAEGAENLEFASQKVVEAIANALDDEKGRWILGDHEKSASELALVTKYQGKARQFVIDRTFVDQGVRWIIDYKLSAPGEHAKEYKAQLQRYASLLKQLDQGLYPIKLMLYYPLNRHADEWAFDVDYAVN